jgi:hypothetical protein
MVFKILQYQVKTEIKYSIKQSLCKKDLTVISVKKNNSAIAWIEYNKEFRYNNCMYDVVKIKTQGDYIYYYCIDDNKENELFNNLDKHINDYIANNSPENKNKTKSVLKKLTDSYFFKRISFELLTTIVRTLDYSVFSPSHKNFISDVLTPPPVYRFL